jgi:hypothetical protein
MAQRKKGKAKGKAKATRKPAAKKAAQRPARKAAAGGGANRRIATLEAENKRLREELSELRGRLEQQERAVPAFNLTADEAAEQN